MLGGDRRHLTGACSGLLQGDEKIPERIALGIVGEYLLAFLGSEDAVAGGSGRLAQFFEGVDFDQPLVRRPVEDPLDGGDAAAA
jgi:hypothetical protein